jgi:hypothetical protein
MADEAATAPPAVPIVTFKKRGNLANRREARKKDSDDEEESAGINTKKVL